MSKIVSMLLVLTCLFGSVGGLHSAAPLTGEPVTADFSARYIRTDGYIDGAEYPRVLRIDSVAELRDYYAANRDIYYLESRESYASDSTAGFLDAAESYDDAFFEKNILILVVLEEGSGSIRHRVSALNTLPPESEGGKARLQPVIERICPEIGTCDMAEWHIIIELSRDCAPADFEPAPPIFTRAEQ